MEHIPEAEFLEEPQQGDTPPQKANDMDVDDMEKHKDGEEVLQRLEESDPSADCEAEEVSCMNVFRRVEEEMV